MVIGFEPLGIRICYLRLKIRVFNIIVISAHAPTEDKEDEEKEEFCEKLERAYDKLRDNDSIRNAKIGKENILKNHAGLYSLQEKNK
jgi:hypothetical protein